MTSIVIMEPPNTYFATAEEALPAPYVPFTLLSVVSRKTHGAAGDFDITLDQTQIISASITVEPRTNTVAHRVVFNFDAPVTDPGTATAIDSLGAAFGAVSSAALGNSVVVTISSPPADKRVTVALTGVNGTTNASICIGFLVGDTTNSRIVNISDINAIKLRDGQTVTSSNLRHDLDLSGVIEGSITGGPTADLDICSLQSGISI